MKNLILGESLIMVGEKLFLKLLFIVSLFVFCDLFAKESEELKAHYAGNNDRSGEIYLGLTNDDNFLSMNYSNYTGYVHVNFGLKSDREIKLKTIDLMGSIVHIDRSADEGVIDMNNRDGKWVLERGLFYFGKFTSEWRKLIRQAKGDLKFCVTCVESENRLLRKYYFKVSAVNLSRFVDLLEQVDSFEAS
ncbi:hypothetical protein BHW_0001700, partial (plasmid) [Borrelia hermsii MTW]